MKQLKNNILRAVNLNHLPAAATPLSRRGASRGRGVFHALLTLLGSALFFQGDVLRAGEFAVVNEEITLDDAANGYKFFYDTNRGPTNWISPDNYYNGQFLCRFEVLEQPSSQPSYLSFCIWGNPVVSNTSPETASPLSPMLAGAGSVAIFSSSPAGWWKQDGGADFTNRNSFYRWGIPHWASNTPNILLAPQGYSTDPRSWDFWEARTNWLPLKVKATVVAVSQGATFSGWSNYVALTDIASPTAPGNLAVVGVSSNSVTLNWTPSTDDVGVTGYRVFRNGLEFAISAGTTCIDSGLPANSTNTYSVKAFDAAGNLSSPSAPVIGVTSNGGRGNGMMLFKHFTIKDPLPGTAYGTAGVPLADFDGDGDLDCALSRRDAQGFWWYERRTDSNWVQHVICLSTSLTQGLGCSALDVDNDGWIDVVFDTVWFKNPGTLLQNPDSAWAVNTFPGAGHDIVAVDINGDGRKDVVTFDGNNLRWFNPAAGLSSNTVATALGHHGGAAPCGYGDIDGDGDVDLVVAGYWYANPGNGIGIWTRYTWPHLVIPNASYGTSIRSWVVDLDRDGDNDIVYSDCDTGYSHVYWVRNEGKGTNWTRFALADPPTAVGDVPGTGSFHSLAVADFDLDGDLDIFAGEQEDPDQIGGGKLPMKPAGLKERGVFWVNSGGNPPTFTPQVIQVDNPGWHDVSAGDVDGDGDLDLVSKVWNKDGVAYHADLWRNDTIVRLDNTIDLSGWHANGGLWQMTNSIITGQQNPPGSGNGGLLLSDASYGDFEAVFDVWPDWGVDTGFYVRTTTNGKAYQITIDYQTNNPMGGIYLVGTGDYGFWDFTISGTNSIQGNPQYFNISDWTNIWNATGWNTFRVIVTNNPPRFITWINGYKIKDYQDTQVRIPGSGMLALQVHPTVEEWPLGAITRFRNIRIKDLTNNIPTPDAQAPSMPTSFAVADVSSTSVSLSWAASTDNIAVTGYRVYRNGVEIGTSTATSFTDAGLNADTTYAYAVRAFDAAANQSGAVVLSAKTSTGGGAGAVPTQGLAFWARADTGVAASGNSVSQWADQSGNNRHATQATSANQPGVVTNALNGRPVMRFDGTNDFLSFNLPINTATGMTIVLISANKISRDPGVNQGNNAPIFWEETASWGWTYLSPFQTNLVMRFGTTQANNLMKYQRPVSIGTNYTMTIGIHSNNTDSIYVNGSLAMSASGKFSSIAGTVNTAYLGRGATSTFFPGDLAEVLVYTRALSAAERVDVENYLRHRYLPGQLPGAAITAPTNNSVFIRPATVSITAAASDPDGVSRVDFFANGALIGTLTNAPYLLVWSNMVAGTYTLLARATDNVGASSDSSPATITVTLPSPPTLNAVGLDQGRLRIVVSGDVVPDYRIESSTNLQDWALLWTTNPVTMPFEIMAPITNTTTRFFRARLGY